MIQFPKPWMKTYLYLVFVHLQVIKYPPQHESQTNVVGNTPHFDSRFVTFVSNLVSVCSRITYVLVKVLQSLHPDPTLQVLLNGKWVDAKPIPNTFVVNFGKCEEVLVHSSLVH